MNINELKMWAEEHSIPTRIVDAFKKLLVNYKADDPEEYAEVMKDVDIENLIYHVHTISINLGNWPRCDYNTVSASMKVYYNKKHIANYKALYLFSGEPEDDFVNFL